MDQAVCNISQDQAQAPSSAFAITVRREILVLGSVLVVLQILDGILTGLGMQHFGVSAEGNAILRSLMHLIGCVPALIVAKSLSVAVIFTLCILSNRISWVGHALKVVIGIYLFAAVIPWTVLLWSRVS